MYPRMTEFEHRESGEHVLEESREEGSYRWAALDVQAHCVYTNTSPSGSYRAFGATHLQWIAESQLDEVARRHGDFAIVGLAASLTLAGGVISDARLAFAGLSDVPVRATDAEDLLVGDVPSAELFDEAARRATEGIDPPADLHGSADYRKKVAATLVRRGLRAAVDNADERQ